MLLVAFLFLYSLICLLTVHAEDIFVSHSFTSATCVDPTFQCPDLTSALAVSASYDTIYVYPGIYNGTQNMNLCIAACAGIEGVTIAGTGLASETVISSFGNTFADSIALYIYENTVTTIANMTFEGFSNPEPQEPNKVGAIEIVDSAVAFRHVVFQNNSGVEGGAVHAKNSNVTLNGTRFENNLARLHGGGIMASNCNLYITGSFFRNNTVSTDPADLAGAGGAVYFIGVNDLTIEGSEFISNEAELSGGAIYMELNANSAAKILRGKISVLDSLFRGNSVNGLGSCVSSGACNSRGGAMHLSVLSASLVNCIFEGNSVLTTSTSRAAQGGAVFGTTNVLDIQPDYVGTYVYNCSFARNSANGQGGALYITGQRLNLLSSDFVDNAVSTVNAYFTDSASQGGALYYTSGSLGSVTSNVIDCTFTANSAFSGWGGAIFGTDSAGTVYVQRSTFTANRAYSSYTNTAHGGAMMVASNFNLNLYDCTFANNSVLPYLQLVPLTYSGSGGAIFAQTTAVNITKCVFNYNLALTGQFDSGSAGGAIMMEDCYPASLTHSTFQSNGAAGYYGYSSFASPGTGGAIYVKFSAAKFKHNTFRGNWATAGGNEASIGGAVAVFFEYSSVAKSTEGVSISHAEFEGNLAFGELCTIPNQAGQGGGLAVVGASVPAVYLSHANFTNNVALTASKRGSSYVQAESVSLGGALSIALSSNITVYKNTFRDNLAYNGAGHDLSSISGQSNQENFVHTTNSIFIAGTRASQSAQVQDAALLSVDICVTLSSLQGQATEQNQQAYSFAPSQGHPILSSVPSSRSSVLAEEEGNLLSSLFAVPEHWQAHLQHTEKGAPNPSAGSDFLRRAAAVKRARWAYLRSWDSSLLQLPGARRRVHHIANQILRLDLWKQTFYGQSEGAEDEELVRVDEGFLGQSSVPVPSFTLYGRRVYPSAPAADSSKVTSLQDLEAVYRRNLYSQLASEFVRLTRESKLNPETLHGARHVGAGAFAAFVRDHEGEKAKSEGEAQAEAETVSPDNPAAALVNFHPYVVITSGRAYFENPAFYGVYHMFFGDFPMIAEYAYDNAYLFNKIIAVPSYSAIFGHITQEDLTISAITASIEIFDSNDVQNYTVRQLNLFNATLQLNRNVTVNGGSFITGSLITAVGENTDSLIPYVQGGDAHPFVTFSGTLYTGVSIESVLAAVGSVVGQNSPALNNSDQTVFTLNSVTLVVEGALVSDSPTENHGSLNLVDFPTRLESNARLLLTGGAMLEIAPQGKLILLTETFIEALTVTAPAVSNFGRVELLGRTVIANYSRSGRLDAAPFSRAASLGSLASRLIVSGGFVQAAGGSTTLFLNHTSQSAPCVYLISSANFSGSVFVDFYMSSTDGIYPDLQLYDGIPSAFTLIAFKEKYSEQALFSFEEVDLFPQSPGLAFTQMSQEVTTVVPSEPSALAAPAKKAASVVKDAQAVNETALYAWGVQVKNIACDQINQYYSGVPEQDALQGQAPNAYACYVCLQNSSCNLCNAAPGSSAGMCAASGGCGSVGVAFSDSCCEGGCNSEYGTCKVNAAHTSFSCDCSKTIWYTGAHCTDLSPEAYVIIFSGVSFVITVVLMVFFYYRSLQQKRIVLDELADGLLNHQTEGVNSEYIQYMQQALILNDVFVKWEEITLESVVGEGSFGVVHKATFRGAQVAVKQMRSMFTELTDKEIEEFRKEAYVMSRLRHPNIVLVMGISLVDQEPVALPKSRSQNMSADMYDSANPALVEGKRAKPQKTVCIITEFLEQGSLADILYGPTKLPAEIWTYELVLTCALQAARGMLYLHSHQPPICHRDLKSSNLVVDDHWVVKVTDFGMSRIVPENVQDRDKGILSPIQSTSSTASSAYPLGPRKFSMGNSPAGRKFSLGWPSQASSSVQSTPVVTPKTIAGTGEAGAGRPGKGAAVEDSDMDQEYPGERASIATVDSAQDARPSVGVDSTGAQSHPSLYSKSSMKGGVSRLSNLNPEMTSNLGTTAWCAPEVLVSGMKTRYTVKVDVYSFGLVLWELWEKKRPFEELTSRFDIMDAVRAGKRPEISANCPPSFRSLIQRCWQTEPSRRPMFKYIVRYLKDELARVKRQKGGAVFAASTTRPSDADLEPRRSGSTFSGTAGGVISEAAEAAEAAAEFLRKSFSFRGSFAGTQQATSPSSGTHRPWMPGTNRDNDVYVHSDSAHNALAALSAAAKRNEDGTLRMSEGSTGARASVTNSATGTGTGTGSAGTGRVSEVSSGPRQSEAVPVKVPEGRSPLVTAVTSERSLSYLTESPAPFSHMQAINRQPSRLTGVAPAAVRTNPIPAPTPSTKHVSNRWRDRYVLNFSGWAPTNPDSGLPPSMASPTGPTTPGIGGLPPTRSAAAAPLAPAAATQAAFSPDVNYNPLTRPSGSAKVAGGSSTILSRSNSNTSNQSSASASPRPTTTSNPAAGAGAHQAREDEMFVLDEDEERKL